MKGVPEKKRSDKRQRKKNKQQHSNQQETLEQQQLMQTMSLMGKLKKKSYVRFHNQLIEFIRRNYVNNINDSSMFKEQWEHKKQANTEDFEIKTFQSLGQIVFYLGVILTFSFTVWLTNIEFFFGSNKEFIVSSFFYSVPLTLLVVIFIEQGHLNHIIKQDNAKNSLSSSLKYIGCCIYLMIKMINFSFCNSPFWLLVELPVLFYLYSIASKYYNSFRIMSLSKKYEYHLKTFDLIFSLMIMAHIISIVVFMLTKVNPENNWSSKLTIPNSVLDLYIYSFYFGCTTILTVGYGDIVPVNTVQISTICVIELVGTAIFAYLVSQIGYNLSTLRKDRQVVEKDLAILQKCRQYYKIQPQMLTKIKSNLLNSKETVNRLRPDEENQLVMKLNQPLRQQFIGHNKLSVLKSSIFFLCRWSKHFQKNIAEVMTSALYMPGQQIFQPLNKERIYIVRLGQVDFYLKQRGNKRQAQKVIKTLKVTLENEVTNNSFGYTAVIGTKPTELEVISRDFTSMYYVDKQKFMNSINQNAIDTEYYHEIKDKLTRCRFPEALEVPVLDSRKFHFTPSKPYLIRKEKQLNHLNKNSRADYIRGKRRNNKKKIIKSIILDEKQKEQIEHVRSEFLNSLQNISLDEESKPLTSVQSIQLNMNAQLAVSLFNISHEVAISCEKIVNKIAFQEAAKHFDNFYPSQNLTNVLERYDRQICFIRHLKNDKSQIRSTSKRSKHTS